MMKCINSANLRRQVIFCKGYSNSPQCDGCLNYILIQMRNLTSCTPLLATTACGPDTAVEAIEAGLHSISQVSSNHQLLEGKQCS